MRLVFLTLILAFIFSGHSSAANTNVLDQALLSNQLETYVYQLTAANPHYQSIYASAPINPYETYAAVEHTLKAVKENTERLAQSHTVPTNSYRSSSETDLLVVQDAINISLIYISRMKAGYRSSPSHVGFHTFSNLSILVASIVVTAIHKQEGHLFNAASIYIVINVFLLAIGSDKQPTAAVSDLVNLITNINHQEVRAMRILFRALEHAGLDIPKSGAARVAWIEQVVKEWNLEMFTPKFRICEELLTKTRIAEETQPESIARLELEAEHFERPRLKRSP